jgi:adenylate cyclase
MLTPAHKLFQFGRFTLDPNKACLSRDGRDVPLRPKSFDVLLYLARNPGRVVTKDELMEFVWPNVFVTDNSLVQCISDIRVSLANDAQDILKTVARRGYLFAAAVTESDAQAAAPPAAMVTQEKPEQSFGLRWNPRYIGASATALAVLVIFGAAWWWWVGQPPADTAATARDSTPHPARASIAVLPFVTLGGSVDDYFARGLTEDIIAALSRFSNLSVLSIKTVLPYAGKAATPVKIGRELRVRYIAEGSVRRNPQRTRVTIQLTNAADGTLLWADQYDRESEGIFAIQDDITRRITGALANRLSNIEQALAAVKPPENLEAYDLVLRGRDQLNRLTRVATSQARQMFERAVEIDPKYAAAYVGLGTVDLRAIHHGWTPDPAAVLERAKNHAHKAIALDEFNPQAHALLGRIYARLGQYERAIDALKRAMALNPSDPDNNAGLGDALLWSGDIDGAKAALELADQLDSKLSTQDLFNLGAAFFLTGSHAKAAHVFERAAARNENNAFIHAMLAAIYQDAGRPRDAQRAMAEMRRINPLFDVDAFGSLFRRPEHRERIIAALRRAAP